MTLLRNCLGYLQYLLAVSCTLSHPKRMLISWLYIWPAGFLIGHLNAMDALQRRVVPEDVVQYELFLVKPDGLNPEQVEEQLTHLVEEILAKVAPLLIQYIWQHQSFNLKYHPEKGIILIPTQWIICRVVNICCLSILHKAPVLYCKLSGVQDHLFSVLCDVKI